MVALQEALLSHLSSLVHTNTPIPCTKNLLATADDLHLLGTEGQRCLHYYNETSVREDF